MIAYRARIEASDCDFLGHMNVARYFDVCSDGAFVFFAAIGLTLEDMREGRRLSFAVVHAESNFHVELLVGESIRLEIDVLAIGGKSVKFRHRLYRCEEDLLAFESIFTSVMFDLEMRRAVPVPDDIRAQATAWQVDEREI